MSSPITGPRSSAPQQTAGSSLCHPSWKGWERLEGVLAEATEMIKAVETGLCEARLKELELFRLEKARQSLKNPAPERNSTNPMSALAFLPSAAACPPEGRPGALLLDPRGGALTVLLGFPSFCLGALRGYLVSLVPWSRHGPAFR